LLNIALIALNFRNRLSILTQVNLDMLSNSIKTQTGTRPTDYLSQTEEFALYQNITSGQDVQERRQDFWSGGAIKT
jgi:hypothetical protein